MDKFIFVLWQWIQPVWQWAKDNFSSLADWASIAGLVISGITLWRVHSLRVALVDDALKRTQHRLFQTVRVNLVGKPNVTQSHMRDINSLLAHVEAENCSSLPFFSRRIKAKIAEIRQDASNNAGPDLVVIKLDELRVLIRNPAQDL